MISSDFISSLLPDKSCDKTIVLPKIIIVLHEEISTETKQVISSKLKTIFPDVQFIDANRTMPECNYANIIIHYGLHRILIGYSSLDFYLNSPDEINNVFLNELVKYTIILNKKTLLYLGKFPSDEGDMDGGSQLSSQLIESLKSRTILDICFIRKRQQTYENKKVRNIRYVPYINPTGNKFQRRLENLQTNVSAICDEVEHDLIIAAHCSKLFGLQKKAEVMNKAIVFPMFLTQSYQRANESVPEEYTKQEQEVLNSVSLVLTPSEEEKNDMMKCYSVPESKIKVIPRGISPKVIAHIRKSREIKLISIGSIKEQKNHLDDLRLLNCLVQRGYSATLFIAGSLYDSCIMDELQEYIKKNKLEALVTFVSGLNREDMSNLLAQMTFGISNSHWETFGRGIFECLASGLPTLVSDNLETVKRLTKAQSGISFYKNIEIMADRIIELSQSYDLYQKESVAALHIAENFSFENERERLLYALIFDRFGYNSSYSLWDLNKCTKIYDGRYSICYSSNGHVRKYFRYKEAKSKAIDELQASRMAFENHLNTPEPIFVGYDCKEDKYFIDYIYVPCVMINSFSPNELSQLESIITLLQKLPILKDNWNTFVMEFIDLLHLYENIFNENVSYDINILRKTKAECFIHGDFWNQNIGVNDKSEIVLFDFQNSGSGPNNWDRCYLYANIPFASIPADVLNKFSKNDADIIKIIRNYSEPHPV